MYSVAQVNKNIKDMLRDLGVVKSSANHILNKISHGDPGEYAGAGEGEMSPEDSKAVAPMMGGEEANEAGGQGEQGEQGVPGEAGEGAKKPPEIKTPEEAKKTVNEAITDLKGVVEGIDNITDQATDMEGKTSSQTFRLSSRSMSEVSVMTDQAIAAIEDAKGAIRHWAFLLRKKTPLSVSGNKFVDNVKEGVQVWRELGTVLATAVPPTGAEFSGDKNLPKRPEKVEIDHYQAGNSEFHTDKAKEDKIPNAASEPRLTDAGNPHELGAYVNAKSVKKNNVFSSALVVRTLDKDRKNGKYSVVTFNKLSDSVGPKNEENYAKFLSPAFAKNVEAHVRKNGIEAVAAFMNAEVDSIGIVKLAREPKVEDKAKLRSYYADAFGDPEYARELTSREDGKNVKTGTELGMGINRDKAGNVAKGGDDMNVAYKPEAESADAEKGGLDGGNKADSLGKGGAPVKDASIEARQARARAAVEFARLAASRGLVKFTKVAIKAKAEEVVAYSDEKFAAQKELLLQMPEVNSALKESRIPDNEETESGIVGNTTTAVREPKGQAPTEGLNGEVKSDAKFSQASKEAAIHATAAVVPQLQTTSNLTRTSFTSNMNTLQNRLLKVGTTLEQSVRRVGPHYKKKD